MRSPLLRKLHSCVRQQRVTFSGRSCETAHLIHNGVTLRIEGIKLDNLIHGLFIETRGPKITSFRTKEGLRAVFIPPRPRFLLGDRLTSKTQETDALWWLPSSRLAVALKPRDDYWLLLCTSRLQTAEHNMVDGHEPLPWAIKVTEKVEMEDVTGLLAIPGFKREVIEIH